VVLALLVLLVHYLLLNISVARKSHNQTRQFWSFVFVTIFSQLGISFSRPFCINSNSCARAGARAGANAQARCVRVRGPACTCAVRVRTCMSARVERAHACGALMHLRAHMCGVHMRAHVSTRACALTCALTCARTCACMCSSSRVCVCVCVCLAGHVSGCETIAPSRISHNYHSV
jgi:hypothetical protein